MTKYFFTSEQDEDEFIEETAKDVDKFLDGIPDKFFDEWDRAEFLHDLYHITQAPLTEHQKYISLEMMIKKEYEDKNKHMLDKLKDK
jgi:hypothetical protein